MKCCQFGSIALGIITLVLFQVTSGVATADSLKSTGEGRQSVVSRPTLGNSIKYTPPAGLGTPKRTQGGGSRGCNQALPTSFTLLVPADDMGLTSVAHPTFVWYVTGDPTKSMKFSLTEPGHNRPLWSQEVSRQKSGINSLALPENAPELVPGKRYRWTLSLLCNNKRSIENSSARGWVQRSPGGVEPSKVSAINISTIDQAQLLAHAGFWYDAVAVLSQMHIAGPQDQRVAQSLITLLDQGGLKQVAEQERKRLNPNPN